MRRWKRIKLNKRANSLVVTNETVRGVKISLCWPPKPLTVYPDDGWRCSEAQIPKAIYALIGPGHFVRHTTMQIGIDLDAPIKEEIGIGKSHENYENIIERAEAVMAKHGKDSSSASMTLGS